MTMLSHCEICSTCHFNSPLSLATNMPSPALPKVSPAAQQPPTDFGRQVYGGEHRCNVD